MAAAARWVIRDKTRLPMAMMQILAENTHISFEGDLHGLT